MKVILIGLAILLFLLIWIAALIGLLTFILCMFLPLAVALKYGLGIAAIIVLLSIIF